MKGSITAASLFAGLACAAAVRRQATADLDPVVLNFALTLEHLENSFYHEALSKFSAQDFVAAGAPASFYKNLQYVAEDEATHVKEITAVINANGTYKPVEPCTYNFPYSDAKGFLGLATILEGVGTSAYLGAAGLITSKDYLTAAASILVSEALHTSLLRSTSGLVPNANPNGTPLDPTSVYTLAAPFFKVCPASNPALPFKAFPAATGPSGVQTAGSSLVLKTTAQVPQGAYLTFISGLAVVSVQGTVSNGSISAAIPTAAEGQTYVVITKSDAKANGGKLVDSDVVAGPAIVEVTPQAPTGLPTANSTASYPVGSTPASSTAYSYSTGTGSSGTGSSGTGSSGVGSSGAGGYSTSPRPSGSAVYTGAASRTTIGATLALGVAAAFFML